MSVSVDTSKLRAIIAAMPGNIDALGRATAEGIVADVVLSFGTSPSAPGDPPGVVTNTLRASMRWEPDGDLRWVVEDGTLYGIFLELGTEKMAARPFVTPVFEQWRQGRFAALATKFGVFDG